MRNRRVLALVLALLVAFAMMPAMGFADETTTDVVISPNPTTDTTTPAKSNDIVILGTSDVHCGIDQNIGYAGLAAYKKAEKEKALFTREKLNKEAKRISREDELSRKLKKAEAFISACGLSSDFQQFRYNSTSRKNVLE